MLVVDIRTTTQAWENAARNAGGLDVDLVRRLFAKYKLDDVARVSDPVQTLHGALSLNKGSALDVMGPKVWWAGFKSVLLRGHRPGRPSGDVFQLGGAFLIHNGEILAAHRSKTSFEQPDFIALAQGS